MNREELASILEEKKISRRVYSLQGGLADDTTCLSMQDGQWCVYYTVRGKRYDVRIFESENDACLYLLSLLREDAKHSSPQ